MGGGGGHRSLEAVLRGKLRGAFKPCTRVKNAFIFCLSWTMAVLEARLVRVMVAQKNPPATARPCGWQRPDNRFWIPQMAWAHPALSTISPGTLFHPTFSMGGFLEPLSSI